MLWSGILHGIVIQYGMVHDILYGVVQCIVWSGLVYDLVYGMVWGELWYVMVCYIWCMV